MLVESVNTKPESARVIKSHPESIRVSQSQPESARVLDMFWAPADFLGPLGDRKEQVMSKTG